MAPNNHRSNSIQNPVIKLNTDSRPSLIIHASIKLFKKKNTELGATIVNNYNYNSSMQYKNLEPKYFLHIRHVKK